MQAAHNTDSEPQTNSRKPSETNQNTRKALRPVHNSGWEMSAYDALKVNYLEHDTKRNRA